MLPKILNKELNRLSVLSDSKIAEFLEASVTTGDTIPMLVGRVANILLATKAIRSINNGTYNFKKVLLIRISQVAKSLDFDTVSETKVSIAKDGGLVCHDVITITGEQEKKQSNKSWYSEPEDFQDYVILKGSNRKFSNSSTDLLNEKLAIPMMVKNIDPMFVDLYTVLLYEDNKTKVNDSNYHGRLLEVAEWTKCKLGQEYTNYRKLDSNSRNYPLNRYGFAYEYGDAFEKWLIEPATPWLVDENEVELAKKYLRDEFKAKRYDTLVNNAKDKVIQALADFELYQAGRIVDFSITHKELGKLLHIIDVNENIIDNIGNYTTSCVSFDFTNSGGINAANQFGDEKFMNATNLLGNDKFDTHQAVANHLGLIRDDAKSVMQGPNHGGRVVDEHVDMVEAIFGERYKYIHMMSQYGMKIADAGVTEVVIERPDGVCAVWYPYSINCPVPMEDGSVVDAIMPYNSAIGTAKHRGLAVSILHSADAFTEHYIQSNLLAMGIHTKTTLDNFYGKPSIKELVIELTFEALEIMEGYAERQMQSIEKQTGILRDGNWQLPERTHALVVNDNIM